MAINKTPITKLIIAPFDTMATYERDKSLVPENSLCLIGEPDMTIANSVVLYENTSGLDQGNITLAKPFSDFQKLLVVVSGDGGGELSTYVVDVKRLMEIQAMAIAKNKYFTLFINHYYWTLNKSSTTTTLNHVGNNCRIWGIYGWG